VIVEPLDWKRRVCAAGCVVHSNPAKCSGPLQGAHMIPQQVLRKHAPGLRWDTRIGVGLCERAHRLHDTYRVRIPRDLLPAGCVELCESVGLGWYLDKHYPIMEVTG
jgi:hypothetical protein